MDELKAPPHAIEAEQAVLAGLLLVDHAYDDVAERLSSDDFYREDHRLIYRAVEDLHRTGQPCDAITVTEWFEANGVAERIDGGQYLVQLSTGMSAANIRAYAEIVREKSIRRALIQAAMDIASRAYDGTGELHDLVEHAEQSLSKVADTRRSGEAASTMDGAAARRAFWDTLTKSAAGELSGLSTGISSLDKHLGRIEPGDFVIIAGRPSMGKTALALNIAGHQSVPVAIFSLETTVPKVVRRMISAKGMSMERLKKPWDMTPAEWQKATELSKKIRSDTHINNTGGMTMGALESEARRLVRHKGAKLIIVDYLQLVRCKAQNRLEEVSEVSRRTQGLAKNLNVPIIGLCQLNRASEHQTDPIPKLADLRESGQLEQDADVVILINRPEQYSATKRPGEADLIVAKSKDGETGTVAVSWQGKFQRFGDLTREWSAT